MNKKYFHLTSISLALFSFIALIFTLLGENPAHAADTGMNAICVPEPKFAYLFTSLTNFQSNVSPISGTGSCQWNVNGIQVISFELTQSPGKYSQQRALDNLTHADPFDRYVATASSNPPVIYKGHFLVSVCSTAQLACVEHVVINSDTLLDMKDITQSSAALDYFSIRRNLETLGMFVVDQYTF